VKTSRLINPSSNYIPNTFVSFDTVTIVLEIHGELLGQRAAAKWYWTLSSPTEIMLILPLANYARRRRIFWHRTGIELSHVRATMATRLKSVREAAQYQHQLS